MGARERITAAAALTALAAPGARAESVREDSLLIFETRVGGEPTGGAVIGYRTQAGLCVILRDLVEALDFAIDVDGDAASGWFVRETRRFSLDRRAALVEIAGRTQTLAESEAFDSESGLCVDAKAAARWFSLALTPDYASSILDVESDTPLPVEERAARRRMQRVAELGEAPNWEDAAPAPYALLEPPVADLGAEVLFGAAGAAVRGEARLAAEVAKLSADVYAAGSSDSGLQGVAATFGRRDPAGFSVLGAPLTEAIAGDVVAPRTRLSAGPAIGRGVIFSNLVSGAEAFDTTSIRGDLSVGWDVELSRNGELLGFRQGDETGRYEFRDVRLRYGRNALTLRYYGPQGQRRDERRDIFIGDSAGPPGAVHFFAAAVQQGTPLVPTGAAKQDAGGLRLQSALAYAVSRRLSLGVSAAAYRKDEKPRAFVDANLGLSVLGSSFRIDYSRAADGGEAFAAAFQTGTQRLSLSGAFERYFGRYESELAPAASGAGLRSRAEARADLAFSNGSAVSFSAVTEKQSDAMRTVAAAARTTFALGRLVVSNTVDATMSDQAAQSLRASGTTLLSTRLRKASLRGQLRYALTNRRFFDGAALALEAPLTRAVGASLEAEYDADRKDARVSASVNWTTPTAVFSAFGAYGESGLSAGARVSFSLARHPLTHRTNLRSPGATQRAMIAPRVFIDEDGDGVFRAGEEILPDAGILLDDRRPPRSNGAGATSAGLWASPAPEPFRVSIDPRTLADSTLSPLGGPRTIRLRPGKVAVVDVPLLRTGDIVGETTESVGGRRRKIGGVALELVDAAGKVRAVAKSEHDGYFAFERAPLGVYFVRVSAEQQARLHFRSGPATKVTLTRSEDLVDSVAIEIVREP